jgi:hypothetical protein
MFPYEREIQQRQEMARVIAPDRRKNEANVRIAKHLMQIGDAVLWRVGDETG